MEISKALIIKILHFAYALFVIFIGKLNNEYMLIFDSFFFLVSISCSYSHIVYINTRSVFEITIFDRRV